MRERFLRWKTKGAEMRFYRIVNFPRGRFQGSGYAIVGARSEVAAIDALREAVLEETVESASEYLRDPVKEGWTVERIEPPFVFFIAEDSDGMMRVLHVLARSAMLE